MSFSNRLPRGAKKDWRYNVIAPEGGLGNMIDEFIHNEGTFLDLEVMRDFRWFLIRLILSPEELIRVSETVYRFESVLGVLLDQDGIASGTIVSVTGSIGREATSIGMPAGVLNVWSRRHHTDIEAS